MAFFFERNIKKGIYEFGSRKGICWLKIFYQKYDKNEENLFINEEEANYTISNNINKYSILSNISDEYQIDDHYEFLLLYPENSTYFRWQQKKFPLEEEENVSNTTASGFKLISNSTEGHKFGGLVKSTIPDSDNLINSLLDGNPGSAEWYFCIGLYKYSHPKWLSSGIPSFIAGFDKPTNVVSLWIRLPFPINFLLLTCNIQSYTTIAYRSVFFISIFFS